MKSSAQRWGCLADFTALSFVWESVQYKEKLQLNLKMIHWNCGRRCYCSEVNLMLGKWFPFCDFSLMICCVKMKWLIAMWACVLEVTFIITVLCSYLTVVTLNYTPELHSNLYFSFMWQQYIWIAGFNAAPQPLSLLICPPLSVPVGSSSSYWWHWTEASWSSSLG